jgi:membrane peptidoglycan carboxypeptidase
MDADGNEIVGDQVVEKPVYKTSAAQMVTEALTGVIKNGTAKGFGLKNTMSAGKTGTTDGNKDGWFVGYTPYYTTSIWVGCDLPQTVEGLKGSTYPGKIWHDFMDQIHTTDMKRTFSYYDWQTE